MLVLTVRLAEAFDEKTSEFVAADSFVVELEHSLASLSKWESRHEKPFLGTEKKTHEETKAYVQDMVLTPDVRPDFLEHLDSNHYDQINAYIGAKMTATWFNDREPQKPNREIITAEIIYYWMFSMQIPLECENWHLNKLLTLIQVFNLKNKPGKKMSRRDLLSRQRQLNAERRARSGSSG